MVPKQLIWTDFPFLVECDSSAESGAGSGGGQRKARGKKGLLCRSEQGRPFTGEKYLRTCHVSSPSLSCFFLCGFRCWSSEQVLVHFILFVRSMAAWCYKTENDSIEITNLLTNFSLLSKDEVQNLWALPKRIHPLNNALP